MREGRRGRGRVKGRGEGKERRGKGEESSITPTVHLPGQVLLASLWVLQAPGRLSLKYLFWSEKSRERTMARLV